MWGHSFLFAFSIYPLDPLQYARVFDRANVNPHAEFIHFTWWASVLVILIPPQKQTESVACSGLRAQFRAATAQVQRRKWTLVGSIVVRDSSGNTINRSWVLSIDSLCLERQTHFIHYFPALNIRLKKSLFALFYVLGQSTWCSLPQSPLDGAQTASFRLWSANAYDVTMLLSVCMRSFTRNNMTN